MSKKKICMVGDFAVGKTSLTQRFVNNIFSDKYLTTIGVKIDTTVVDDTTLVVWDVAGRDSLSPLNVSYLVGASGIVLVADGTRPSTVESLPNIWEVVSKRIGDLPVVVALNKYDSKDWDINQQDLDKFEKLGWTVLFTSAKEAHNVSQVFEGLLEKINSQ